MSRMFTIFALTTFISGGAAQEKGGYTPFNILLGEPAKASH